MKPSKGLALALVAIVAAVLIWQFKGQLTGTSGPELKKISIGWIGPTSGPVNIIGVDSLKAVRLAIEEFRSDNPGFPVELFHEDDQYQHRNSIIKYEKLVKEHQINVLVLATYSATEKIAELAANDHVVVINSIDNDQKLSRLKDKAFLIAKKTEDLGDLIVKKILKLDRKNTFILHFKDDDFMPVLGARVKDRLDQKGIATKLTPYGLKTIDFKSHLQSAKDFGADSFVYLGYEASGIAIKQTREMGFTKEPILTANLGFPVRQKAGIHTEGVYFTNFEAKDGPEQKIKAFLNQFKGRFKNEPDLLWTAVQSYDSLNLVLAQIKNARSTSFGDATRFAAQMKSHLLQTHKYNGLSGTFSISDNGSANGIAWSLYQWSNSGPAKRILR